MAIVTRYIHPPIPIRSFDWSATLDDYDPGEPDGECGYHGSDPIGYGAIEADAIAELKNAIEERASVGAKNMVAAAPRYCSARANLGISYRSLVSDCGKFGCQRACRGYL